MKIDKKVLLSTLWIFAILNYIYADILSLYEPGVIQQIMSNTLPGITFTHGFLLIMGIMMETAIVMVLLSRILKYKWNKITNIISGIIHTLAVSASMFVGSGPSFHYIFFGTIEIITTISIIVIAWRWKE